MNVSSVLVIFAFLALSVAAQRQSHDADLGPREQAPEAEEQGNKKDKRGLLGPAFGYDGYAQPAASPYAVPVAYTAPYSPFGYGAYKTPAVVAPYALANGLANGYAGPIAQVAYSPAFAAPAAATYAVYRDGAYSKAGAYAVPAPYGYTGYVNEGYGPYGGHNAYAY